MKMPLEKWSGSTVVSLTLTMMLGIVPCQAIDGQTAGQNAGKSALTKFGSKNSVNTNISQPMTNSANLMQTVDGAKTFQATLNAPSADKFLEILIQPSGTGDLQQVLISQDNNADGVTDNVYTLPMRVSGVCANGFISCTAGTWLNCINYTWGADASNNVTAVSASLVDLGGCYCINSSCGSNLVWTNSSIVLKDLGGGIVNAIHQNNPALTISSVSSTPVTITYFGQVTSKATTGSVTALASTPAISTATSYYKNVAQLTAARDNIAVSQSSDPSSFYYMMSNSVAAQNTQGKLSNCTVDRVAGITSTSKSYNNSGNGQLCTDHLVYLRIHKVNNLTYELQYLDTGPGGVTTAHANCNDNPGGSGWHTFSTVAVPPDPNKLWKVTTATTTLSNITTGGCNSGSGWVDGVVNGFDTPVTTSTVCGGKGAQAPTYSWNYFFEFNVDEYGEAVDNKCSALENDPDCTLKDELVDTVVTYQNFNATGLNQLPSCQTFTGTAGTNKVCRPWWKKRRTYVCGQSSFDFSNVGTRFGKVVSTATDNTTNLTFQDPRLGATGWSVANGSIDISGRQLGADCELGCKTRVPKSDTQTTTSGNVTDLRVPGQSYDIFYRTCVDGVCPVEGPTEQITDDCQCLNNFNESAVFMQTLRLAGKDNICSSGQKKPMQ